MTHTQATANVLSNTSTVHDYHYHCLSVFGMTAVWYMHNVEGWCQLTGTAEHNVATGGTGAGVGPGGNIGHQVASHIPGTAENKMKPKARGRPGIITKIKKAIPGYAPHG